MTWNLDTPEKLPCGCEVGTAIVDGMKTFVMRPCSLTCDYYLYALEESKKQGNRIERRWVT
jgi:hypothetical protein